jgi:hypothetical protein
MVYILVMCDELQEKKQCDSTTYPIFVWAIAAPINMAGSGSSEGLQITVAARHSAVGFRGRSIQSVTVGNRVEAESA